MNNNIAYAVTGVIICTMMGYVLKNRRFRRRRSLWCKKWHLRRNEGRGFLNMLNKELLLEDPGAYQNFLRLNKKQFDDLLISIEPLIKRQDTNMRECLSAQTR